VGDSVRFQDGAIDQMPHRVREEEITPTSTPELSVAAIAQVAIGDPSRPSRVGGHVPPRPANVENGEFVSKTGRRRDEWIAASRVKNYYWNKTTKAFQGFEFVDIDQPATFGDIHWLGYGYLISDWYRKEPKVNTESTVVSGPGGAIVTTTKIESGPAEILAVRLNQTVTFAGTYYFRKVKRVETPTVEEPSGDPYVPPITTPACTPVCVPSGPPQPAERYLVETGTMFVNGGTISTHSQGGTVYQGGGWDYFLKLYYGSPLPVPTPPVSIDQLRAKLPNAVFEPGPANYSESYKQPLTYVKHYEVGRPYQPEECTCPPSPAPAPAPSPTPAPTPAPIPGPSGVKLTEDVEFRLIFEAIDLKPGLARPYKWEEESHREAIDGVQTAKTQSQTVDMWLPLVTNEAGNAVIAVQVSGTSTAPTPPPLNVQYWWSAPGSTGVTNLSRVDFEPIFFSRFTPGGQGVIAQERQPVPDLLTPEGKPAYLARVKVPTGEEKPPDRADRLMSVEFWSIPQGVKTVRKLKVKTLRIPEGTPIKDYSYHPGTPSPTPSPAPSPSP
jgi:hypothetical protein